MWKDIAKQLPYHSFIYDIFSVLHGFFSGISEKTPSLKASVAQFSEHEVPVWPHVLRSRWRTSAFYVHADFLGCKENSENQ